MALSFLLLPDVRLQICETVAYHPNPWASHRSFKMFKISASENINISDHHSLPFVSTTTIPITVPVYACQWLTMYIFLAW